MRPKHRRSIWISVPWSVSWYSFHWVQPPRKHTASSRILVIAHASGWECISGIQCLLNLCCALIYCRYFHENKSNKGDNFDRFVWYSNRMIHDTYQILIRHHLNSSKELSVSCKVASSIPRKLCFTTDKIYFFVRTFDTIIEDIQETP